MSRTEVAALRRVLVALLALPLALAACTEPGEPDHDVVAVLLANAAQPRGVVVSETARDQLQLLCPACDVLVRDAAGDPGAQAGQLREVLDDGADVLLLDPVDAEAAGRLVEDSSVPVVAINQEVDGARAYVGTDPAATGTDIAEALLSVTRKRPTVVVATGPEQSFAEALTAEVVRALGRRARVVASVPDPQAAAEAARKQGADVVLTGDDRDAEAVAGAFAKLRRAPAVVGYGGELDAVRRLVTGEQAVTVHAPWDGETAAAVGEALRLIEVEVPTPSEAPTPTATDGVRTTLLTPVVVTLPTLTNTVVRRGIHTTRDICAGTTAQRCTELGIR